MLTDQELNNIFLWQPYRKDWPVDINQFDQNDIESYFGELIKSLTLNTSFSSCYSESGGLSNYLEFICYPIGYKTYEGNAIIVFVSLCAPIVVYGQINVAFHSSDSYSRGALFTADETCLISDPSLLEIEKSIKIILAKQKLTLLDSDFAGRELPEVIIKKLLHENHNEGQQYLHGIFQKGD